MEKEFLSNISQDEYNGWEERTDREQERDTRKMGSIVLLSEFERAKAKGIREEFNIFLKYAIRINKNEKIHDDIKDIVSSVKEEWKSGSFDNKFSAAIVMIPISYYCLSVYPAIIGIRTLDFLIRIREGMKVKKKIIENGMEEKLNSFIDYYSKEDIADPYVRSGYSMKAVAPFADTIEEKKGNHRP